MTSSTITISGWTSLGAVAALIECRSTCGLWLIDAASQPNVSVVTGDMFLSGGDIQLFQPAATIWAIPGAGASSAVAGVSPQNIASGGGSGSNASVGSTGAAAPTSATAVGFQNAAGNLVLPTPSAGLPVADSGAAITGASIPAGGVGLTGWLSAIWSKLSGTLAVSAASLPLPTGAATSTLQTTINATLGSPFQAGGLIGNSAFGSKTQDGAGVSITSTTVGAKQRLDVALAAGAIPGATAPNYTDVIGGIDGSGNARQFLTDTSGRLVANVNSLPPLPSGSNIIGKVGIDQTAGQNVVVATATASGFVDGSDVTQGLKADAAYGGTGSASVIALLKGLYASMAGATPAGANVIGYAGSLNTQVVVTPTITTSYASGVVVGGTQTLTNFFRNAAQPSATLSQFMLGWTGAETINLTAYIFAKAPTGTGLTDGGTPVFSTADYRALVTTPITTTLAAPAAGSTKNLFAQSLSLSVKSLEAGLNLYVVIVADAAIATSVNGDLFFSVSGVLD